VKTIRTLVVEDEPASALAQLERLLAD